jgi:hypothetical protein
VMDREEPRLPPGYRLDRSDPDVWALRLPEREREIVLGIVRQFGEGR